jgi:Flp pilus assembly pilin Flp
MIDRVNVQLGTLLATPSAIRDRLKREEGQAFVEYALVLLVVAVALTAAAGVFITPFRKAIVDAFTAISNALNTNSGTTTTP